MVPVLGANGQPMYGPDGQPLMQPAPQPGTVTTTTVIVKYPNKYSDYGYGYEYPPPRTGMGVGGALMAGMVLGNMMAMTMAMASCNRRRGLWIGPGRRHGIHRGPVVVVGGPRGIRHGGPVVGVGIGHNHHHHHGGVKIGLGGGGHRHGGFGGGHRGGRRR